MRSILLAILTYAALVLDAAGIAWESVPAFAPRFLPLMIVAALLIHSGWPAIAWAALAGLLADCLTPGPLGVGMLCATVTAWFVRRVTQFRPGDALWMVALIGTGTLFLDQMTAALLRDFLHHQPIELAATTQSAAAVAASTMTVGLTALILYRTLARFRPIQFLLRTTAATLR